MYQVKSIAFWKSMSKLAVLYLATAAMSPASALMETVVRGQRQICGKNGVPCPNHDSGGARPSGAPQGGPGGSGGNSADNATDEQLRARVCQETKASIDKDKWEVIRYQHFVAEADKQIQTLSRSPILEADDLAPMVRKCRKGKPCEQRKSEQEIVLQKINDVKFYRSGYASYLAELKTRIDSNSMRLARASCPR